MDVTPRVPLKRLASIRPSNVDKHSNEGEGAVLLCNYVDVYKNDRISKNLDFMRATATEGQIERFSLRCQDVLITKDSEEPTDIGVPAFVPEDLPGVVCGYHLALLRPDARKLHGGYLFWALQSADAHTYFSGAATGITRHALSSNDIAMLKLRVPPVDEQQRIANFLDEKTRQIDALVEEKDGLLKRLDELRNAEINARVLGRGYPGGRSSSGIEELGSIPKHWTTIPLMYLTDPKRPIMYGIVLPGPHVDAGPAVPIVKGGDVRPDRLKRELLNCTTPEIEAPYARARLARNDIVYSIRGTIGAAELVPAELEGVNITQDVARIAPGRRVCAEWLVFAVKAPAVFSQLEQLSLGAAVRGINIYDLKRARIPTPPPEEQEVTARALRDVVSRIERLVSHTVDHIRLLRAYRLSLISAAVTGQLAVGAV